MVKTSTSTQTPHTTIKGSAALWDREVDRQRSLRAPSSAKSAKRTTKNYTSHSTEDCRSKAAKEQHATAHVATNQGSGNDTHGGKKTFFGSQSQ
jgi:hypothetical protein